MVNHITATCLSQTQSSKIAVKIQRGGCSPRGGHQMGMKLQQIEAPEPSDTPPTPPIGGGFNSRTLLRFTWGLHLYSSDLSAMARLVGVTVSSTCRSAPRC